MNEWHDSPIENRSAGEFRVKSKRSKSGSPSSLGSALKDLEQEEAFEIRRLFERVRTGARVWNAQFDRILPLPWRRFSVTQWTPVQVACRAAQLLVTGPESRVLDVGSGPGKFCLVGALATLGHFTGVEQRPHLANFSRSFAERYEIPRVDFVCANAEDLDWCRYNAFYFYNPFYENLDPDKKIDEHVELSPSLYDRYIKMTQDRLAQAPSGTRVVTFHGMGGDMPDGYERVLQEFQDIGLLDLWVKNPSPEEISCIHRNSLGPERLQAPSHPALDEAEMPLWISICTSAPDTGDGPED
jgi:SAM-dependent methyltransferase